MMHLDDERILAAARSESMRPGAGTGAAQHLADCSYCRRRVAAAAALRDAVGAVEAEEVPGPGPAVPSFDEVVLPALRRSTRPERELAAGAAPSGPASWRLTAALVLRQARLVPHALWPLTALGFAVLLVLAWRSGPYPGLLLGPGVTLLVTMGVLAVCEPRRDPRRELLYAMPVPPVAVWLARLALVVGVDLIAAAALSAALARLPGGGADAAGLVAVWLGPALLTAALAVFGSVWQSPMAGAVLGGCGWLTGVAAAAGHLLPAPGALLGAAATVWTTNAGTLAAALLLVAAAAVLVTRPGRALRGGAA
ncbi:hypothetical protein [Streptomonospora wellingtoniae]|uniref:Zf-HC2 domain-containing protein n=1 Tax=Streptomonospora wellingtoniae TaxID=3075544 RepID=A0ABU2KQC9_9ACTN|nr:hypothetical protein [Streptomonospora sp. DSM 45055]MDT0301348.1 hypothetical protein [Streptomonospora sp. DSM 45055]